MVLLNTMKPVWLPEASPNKRVLIIKKHFLLLPKHVTICIFIVVATSYDWLLYQMDIHNAFLHGDLDEEIYIKVPLGSHRQGGNLVCHLQKSLYSLKQASQQWNSKLTEALINIGFHQSKHDYAFFTRKQESSFTCLLIYVDDILITRNDNATIEKVKHHLHKTFKIKDLGVPKYFLGIKIARCKRAFSQRKYTL